MSRHPQKIGMKGSLRWIQKLVNDNPHGLNSGIRSLFNLNDSEAIEWLSPLKDDQYAEYRDSAFLKRLNITLKHKPLKEFWPNQGPQWDALGRTGTGKILLVEAKAHVEELVSPPTRATGESLRRIRSSLTEAKEYVNSKSNGDWSSYFYQYTNRIAHLYVLRVLNEIPAYLVFIYFLNDEIMQGPGREAEWKAAIKLMHKYLGIKKNRLTKYMADVFIDVNSLSGKD
jgi:hypothetical protein